MVITEEDIDKPPAQREINAISYQITSDFYHADSEAFAEKKKYSENTFQLHKNHTNTGPGWGTREGWEEIGKGRTVEAKAKTENKDTHHKVPDESIPPRPLQNTTRTTYMVPLVPASMEGPLETTVPKWSWPVVAPIPGWPIVAASVDTIVAPGDEDWFLEIPDK